MKKVCTTILLLFLSLTINAMEDYPQKEQQKSASNSRQDEPLHIGIITDILCDSDSGKHSEITLCEKDLIVYTYNDKENTFEYVERITHNYIPAPKTTIIQTMPVLASLQFCISNIKLAMTDTVCAEIQLSKPRAMDRQLSLGTTTIYETNERLHSRRPSNAVFRQSAPGAPYTFCPLLTFDSYINARENSHTSNIITSQDITNITLASVIARLENPTFSHSLVMLTSCLKLIKENDTYITVPNENSPKIPFSQDDKEIQ